MKQHIKTFTKYYLISLFWGLLLALTITLCTTGVSYAFTQEIAQATNDGIISAIITGITVAIGGSFVAVLFTFLENT